MPLPARTLGTLVVLTALLASGPAAAEEGAVLEVWPEKELLQCPDEQPALLVKAPRSGRMSLKVEAEGEGGASHSLAADVKAGKVLRQTWPQAEPEASWRVTMHLDYEGGKTYDGVMMFTYTCAPLIHVALAGLDLAKGRLKLDVSGPAVRAEVEVSDDEAGLLASKTLKLSAKKKRQKVTVSWPAGEGGFGGLELKVFDRHGAWVQLRLVPFSVEIPHEEVVFGFGKWDIRPSETPKLEDTLATIREELERFAGDLSQPSLYIGGHTDTVGSKADNRKLSNNRARAIGRWFLDHGFSHAVWYAGFGEEVPAVDTGDNTAEAANRRAVYLLSNVPPSAQAGMPRARWRRLK